MAQRYSGRTLTAALAAVVVVVLAGVGGWILGSAGEESSEATTVTVTAQPEEMGPETTAGTGHGLYVQAGCSACHGLNAEGTDVGPSLPGHSAAAVRQQVRSPLAQMPAYPAAQLSDDDLERIAAYIAGLKPTEVHVEPVRLSEIVAIHHWMALSAISAGDRGDALHHVGHLIERVKGEHLEAMKRARTLLREGKPHEAEHLIQEMLAGKVEPKLGLAKLYLRLALTAVDQRDRSEAIHQLRHFLETAQGAERAKAEAALAHLRDGDLHGAEHGIADLLGIERD